MDQNRKRGIFKIAAVLFLVAVIAATVDIFRKTSPPGSKKWGTEAIRHGRDTFKKESDYKPKIERIIGQEGDSTAGDSL